MLCAQVTSACSKKFKLLYVSNLFCFLSEWIHLLVHSVEKSHWLVQGVRCETSFLLLPIFMDWLNHNSYLSSLPVSQSYGSQMPKKNGVSLPHKVLLQYPHRILIHNICQCVIRKLMYTCTLKQNNLQQQKQYESKKNSWWSSLEFQLQTFSKKSMQLWNTVQYY